jgi:polyisoprenyl-phosphate glycosyltransferase
MVSSNPSGSPLHVLVLMPLRDDWASAAELIRQLDRAFSSFPCVLDVLLVDDGSVQACNSAEFQSHFGSVQTIRILRLRRNLGHQRAIAIGLAYIKQTLPCDAVLVMDADGEDTPSGALELVRSFSDTGGTEAIFAERSRRMESATFRTFYWLYKTLHRILTGLSVRVGNFSIVPSSHLDPIVVVPDLWNHYAAAIFRSGLLFTVIPIPRGYRISGTSKMNFVALVTHGLSAISVFGDIVGVRLLIASLSGSLLAGAGILAVVAIRIFTRWAIPGWASYAAGILAIILIQFITIAASFTFFILSSRANLGFVPERDYGLFVAEVVDIYRR